MNETNKKDSGVVRIHGKEYRTVANRIAEFREQHPEWSIVTELVSADDVAVVVKASILDVEGRVIATGLAEETRASSQINRTSALENAETSAVGRALAFFGLAGTEIASADEVAGAINTQHVQQFEKRAAAHMAALWENLDSVTFIKQAIAEKRYDAAYEAWHELDNETKQALWVAPTKGGCFSTHERTTLKDVQGAKQRELEEAGVSE